jgi:hypothetical protein
LKKFLIVDSFHQFKTSINAHFQQILTLLINVVVTSFCSLGLSTLNVWDEEAGQKGAKSWEYEPEPV